MSSTNRGREHLPVAYEVDRLEAVNKRLRADLAAEREVHRITRGMLQASAQTIFDLSVSATNLRQELEENSDAVTKLQIEAEVTHTVNDALVDKIRSLVRDRDEDRAEYDRQRKTLWHQAQDADRQRDAERAVHEGDAQQIADLMLEVARLKDANASFDKQIRAQCSEITSKLGARVMELEQEAARLVSSKP